MSSTPGSNEENDNNENNALKSGEEEATTAPNFDYDTGSRVKKPSENHDGNDDDQKPKPKKEEENDDDEINRMMALQQDDGEEEHIEKDEAPALQDEENVINDDNDANLFPEEEVFNNGNDGIIQPLPINQPLPPLEQQPHHHHQQRQTGVTKWYMIKLHYTKLSLLSAFLLIHHALRTRQQVYLALVYLTTSRLSYILLGNAIVALTVSIFQFLVSVFLNGLRPNEADTIGESMRWNVTETCLALTIFRSQIDVGTCGMFLMLVLAKCLHWAAEIRGSQLRMTEETFDFPEDENQNDEENDGGNNGGNQHQSSSRDNRGNIIPYLLFFPFSLFFSKKSSSKIPHIKPTHFKFILLTQFLLCCDILAVGFCAVEIGRTGPSVHILFGFEAAILAVGAINTLVLYEIHLVDGLFSVLHWWLGDAKKDDGIEEEEEQQQQQQQVDQSEQQAPPPPPSTAKKIVDTLSISWRDHRATLTFATELLSQAAKFLFYVIFFAIVFTYYGMPINIFREVYMSYQSLRRRLSAFHSYRKLTYNMNERFESVTSEEELEELGRVCIICRDVMDCHGGSKKLPGCGHAFHRHCLREWLVQQQTCPTCRGDIVANEARAKAEKKRKEEEKKEQKKKEEEQKKKEEEQKKKEEEQKQEAETAKERVDNTESNTEAAVKVNKIPAKKKKMAMEKKTPAFPCLYRVLTPSGAAVFDPALFKNGVNGGATEAVASTSSASPTIVRTISCGKIIVCTNMKWFSGDEKSEDDEMNETPNEEQAKPTSTTTISDMKKPEEVTTAASGMMLEMPDGWVRESDLQRMLPFVLPDDDDEDAENEDDSFVEVEHNSTKAMSSAAVVVAAK